MPKLLGLLLVLEVAKALAVGVVVWAVLFILHAHRP